MSGNVFDWSPAQLEVINSNDDRILVSASAGSGKTTVMIERILRLIGDGVKLTNMLICTFTKASASDMRAKLYSELSKRKMRSALKDLSRADISTIDSFCQRIVAKYFYILGIDPQFEVLDESEAVALKTDAIDRAIEENTDPAFSQLRDILRSRRSDKTLAMAIRSIMDFAEINPDAYPRYDYDGEKTSEILNKYLLEKKRALMRSIDRICDAIQKNDIRIELFEAIDGVPFRKHKSEEKEDAFWGCYEYLKDCVKKHVELVEKTVALKAQSLSCNYINALIDAACTATEKYTADKAKRAALDFSDLENMALKVLRSEAAQEIVANYKYVFVDEYQDINPLQEQIISAISTGNNLFMVGDLKQSIYAFRGCDPQIFKAKFDEYGKGNGGKLISLDTNYRCAKSIVSFVNSIFGRIMTEEYGGIDYKSRPMIAHSDFEGYVKFNLIRGGSADRARGLYSVKNENKFLSDAEAEATVIVSRIVELLQKPDKAPVKFKDIAILTRGMGKLETLVIQKLRNVNIPVSLKERAFYLERPETGQLIAFLRLLDNRLDDKAMAISMLSPIGGFCEDELVKLRLSGNGSFYQCVLDAAKTDDKVGAFIEKLDRYYELSLTLSADELADLIVSECGYFNYAFGMSDEAAEILDMFLAFLGSCPYKNSLHACLKYIDERDPYAEINGDENSVKLMTVHKSKGLEFKYVFVIGLGKRFNMSDLYEHVVVGKEVVMNVYADHEAFCSDAKFLACERERKKMIEEEMRILYVALTRAKEGLELFGVIKGSSVLLDAYTALNSIGMDELLTFSESGSPIGWLIHKFFIAAKYDADEIVEVEANERQFLFGKADDASVAKLRAYFKFKPEASAPVKSYVTKLAHSDDEPVNIMYDEESDGNAIERGNAYHRAMERIDFDSPDLSVMDEHDASLIDTQKLLAAAEHMRGIVGEMYKEKPFIIKLDASEVGVGGDGKVLVQGVIDLLVIDGDNATIVDYKTGKIHGPFEHGYINQLNLYALAVERLLSKKVVSKRLYYFDSESFVEIE